MAFESLTERLNGVFKKLRGKGKLNEADIKAAMREVRMALLEADVNYKVAKDFCAQVSERAMGQEVMESLTPAQQVVKIVNEELTNLMGGNEPKYLRLKNKGQTVLMMCGLQGNGKTTHAAKLGKYYRSQGRRPLLVACDIYRPAAIEQLKVSRPVSRSLRWAPKSQKSSRRRHLPTRRITAMTLLFSIPQAVCRSMTSSWMSWCASSRLSRSMKRCWSWTPWPVRKPSMWPRALMKRSASAASS